jgi:hypothetical protein
MQSKRHAPSLPSKVLDHLELRMKRIFLIALTLLLFPVSAAGHSSGSFTTASCSSDASFSFLDVALLSCLGDFYLSGGYISSDYRIEIHAVGTLSISDMLITAPVVELDATTVLIGSGTNIALPQNREIILINPYQTPLTRDSLIVGEAILLSSGANISVGGSGAITLNRPSSDGGTIVLGGDGSLVLSASGNDSISVIATAVPEPSTCALLAVGLFAVGGIARRKQQEKVSESISFLAIPVS